MTKMNNPQLIEMLDNYSEWIKQFQFDPTYGYLIDPSYYPVSYNYELLKQILGDLHHLNNNGDIIQRVQQMPQIVINKQIVTYRDMVILHDSCSYIIHSFVKIGKDKGKIEAQMKLPRNLAIPLVESASYLKIKTGMATGICYNWEFVQTPSNLDKISNDDIKIKYYYSQSFQSEGIFFRVSVVTSYFLNRIIRNCYEINWIITLSPMEIEEVIERLKKIRFFLQRIFQQNLQIQHQLDKQFFFNVLRVFVTGYQNIYFEGIDQRISSSGGAGGYDPSFQTFERAFGIRFEGELAEIQKKLRNGMPVPNRKLIDFFEEHSLIREYCQCTKQLQNAYNLTIEGYVKYLELHGSFIQNFLINMMPTHMTRSTFGGSGAPVIKIVDKYKFVREQKL